MVPGIGVVDARRVGAAGTGWPQCIPRSLLAGGEQRCGVWLRRAGKRKGYLPTRNAAGRVRECDWRSPRPARVERTDQAHSMMLMRRYADKPALGPGCGERAPRLLAQARRGR